MAISWHLTPKRGIFTAFVQKTWQFHGQKNFLAMKILGHFLKKRSSNWKKHGNFMAFKKKIQKNRNVAELPRFESPDVAFQNFPAATLPAHHWRCAPLPWQRLVDVLGWSRLDKWSSTRYRWRRTVQQRNGKMDLHEFGDGSYFFFRTATLTTWNETLERRNQHTPLRQEESINHWIIQSRT